MKPSPYKIQLTFHPPTTRRCPFCGEKMTFEPCEPCAGTSSVSRRIPGRERCPISIQDCEDCEGQGGHWICPNTENHPPP